MENRELSQRDCTEPFGHLGQLGQPCENIELELGWQTQPDDLTTRSIGFCRFAWFVDVFLRFFGTASGTLIIGNRVGPRSSCFDTLESLDTEFASDWICWIWQEKQLWCCTHDRYAREVCGHISATGDFSWEQCVGFLLVSVSEVTQMTP